MSFTSSRAAKIRTDTRISVVTAPFAGGQRQKGVDDGPAHVLNSGLLELLGNAGYDSDDIKVDLPYTEDLDVYAYPDADANSTNSSLRNAHAVSTATHHLSQRVYNHAKNDRFVLTVGGDHSIAIGTISALEKAVREKKDVLNNTAPAHGDGNTSDLSDGVAVIWVDAHADINTSATSSSGNMHGMPLAFLTGLESSADHKNDDIFSWLQKEHLLKPERLIYIGLRDVDEGEKQILRDNPQIKAFSIDDVERLGIARVVELALDYIPADIPIHLSFDIDALDPQFAPSTGTPVPGGLTLREGNYIARRAHDSGRLISMDLVEINPGLPRDASEEGRHTANQVTLRSGLSVVKSALGESLL